MIGILFLSLCVGAPRMAQDVTLDELRALCVRETNFDFCGSGWPADTNAVGHTERELRALLSCGAAHYGFRLEFQRRLEALDRAILAKDRDAIPLRAADVRSLMESLTDRAKGENGRWLLLYRCLERASYEMARVDEAATWDDAALLDLLLPDRLFVPPPKRIHRASYHLLRGFRRLLVVGALIRRYQRDRGILPQRMEDMALPSGFMRLESGMRLHYEAEGNTWHLYYARAEREAGAFNVYVPTLSVGDLAKWPCWGSPNYSSDFSRKRRFAYCRGDVLNAASDVWACRLENGRFVKGVAFLSTAVASGGVETAGDEPVATAEGLPFLERMATESQRREFGPFPAWTVGEDGFRWYLFSVRYMRDLESDVRDCNVSVVSAFYRREEDGCYKIKFSMRKRMSKVEPWKEVDCLEICGSLQDEDLQGFKIREKTMSDIKVRIDVRTGACRYFAIDVRYGKWGNELSADLPN